MDAASTAAAKYKSTLPAGVVFRTEVLARLSALETAAARLAYSPPPSEIAISFETDSIEIPEIYSEAIRKAAASWRDSGTSVTVTGYADARGSDAGNQALSQRRAEAVAALLRRYGATVSGVVGMGVAADLSADYGTDRIVVIRPVAAARAS